MNKQALAEYRQRINAALDYAGIEHDDLIAVNDVIENDSNVEIQLETEWLSCVFYMDKTTNAIIGCSTEPVTAHYSR